MIFQEAPGKMCDYLNLRDDTRLSDHVTKWRLLEIAK